MVTITLPELERSPDHHTVAGGDDLDLGVTVVEDGPRGATDHRRRPEHTQADGQAGVRTVAVRRYIELRLRLAALLVVEDERVVEVARRSGGDAGADEGEHSRSGHDATGRELLLRHIGPVRGERGDGHRDERSAHEHRPRHVLVPRVVGEEPHGRGDFQRRRLHLDAAVEECFEREVRPLAHRDCIRCGLEKATARVSPRRSGADPEGVAKGELRDVVGGGTVGGHTGCRGDVAARVQQPDAAVRERGDACGEVGERQAPDVRIRHLAGEEPFVVRVATRCRARHGDHHHAVRVAVEDGGRVLQPRRHFLGARVVHDDDRLNVRAGGERRGELGAFRNVGRRAVAHLRPQLAPEGLAGEDDGHRARTEDVARVPDFDDMALVGRGARREDGGIAREGRGEGKEKERADHGFSGLRKERVVRDFPLRGRANRSRKLRNSQKNGRIFANCFIRLCKQTQFVTN